MWAKPLRVNRSSRPAESQALQHQGIAEIILTNVVQILVREAIGSSLCIRLDNWSLEELYSSITGRTKLSTLLLCFLKLPHSSLHIQSMAMSHTETGRWKRFYEVSSTAWHLIPEHQNEANKIAQSIHLKKTKNSALTIQGESVFTVTVTPGG